MMIMLVVLVLLVLVTVSANTIIDSTSSSSSDLNNWPIVGLFAQPTQKQDKACGGNCQYIAASYVKYLESAGARVVPISYYATNEELDVLFKSLNGFFFPGGGVSFPPSAQYIFDKTIEANKQGDFSPLWGTCMGFQWLLLAATKQSISLDPPSGQMDAYNLSIPLNFTSAAKDSKLFSSAPSEIVKILETEDVTMNNHHYGIYPAHFYETPALTSQFKVLSTNKDRQGVEFISTIESYNYPIFGTQWHPEKNPFEWGQTNGIPNEAINHSPEGIVIAQYTANFFVQQARHSKHKYENPADEQAALIENYSPVATTGDFMSTYFFHF